MKRILVVGGANGIGLSIATELAKRETTEKVYIVDKAPLADENRLSKMESYEFDLTSADYSIFDKLQDVDGVMITAGFGRQGCAGIDDFNIFQCKYDCCYTSHKALL